MKVLYLHQYFNFPSEPGGTRSYWIVKAMQEKNWKVEVVTSTYNKPIEKGRYTKDGINITYLPVYYDQRISNYTKILAFLKFSLLAIKMFRRTKDFDVVYCTSTPLTIGIPGIILKKLRPKIYFVFEVRDLWPLVPIELGEIRNVMFKYVALKLELSIYRHSNLQIALSPGMLEGIEKRNSDSNTLLAPNMSKIDLFYPRCTELGLLNKYGLNKDTFKVIYFGAIGPTNDISYALRAAKVLEDEGVDFLFLGHGKDVKRVRECGLKNVTYLGHLPLKKTSELLNACDVSLVLFKNEKVLGMNSPNKLFDSLAGGKPIIVNSSGWTKDLVEEYSCGLYSDPKEPQSLVNAILRIRDNKSYAKQLAKSARRLAESTYNKDIITNKIINKIEEDVINFTKA